VWGTDTASTSAFVVANSASTTVFAVYNNGNATYSGSIFQSSDQRLKTDIQALDASSSLSFIDALNPVSYIRLDQPGQGSHLGFVAQEVQRIFPQLVSPCGRHSTLRGGGGVCCRIFLVVIRCAEICAVCPVSSHVPILIEHVGGD
jgi:hypothetical protein